MRKGDWMQVYGGLQFWPLDPRPEEIHIEVIAHALGMTCRYGGQCDEFYSVAEHSVHLARKASKKNKLWALLHDAPEGLGLADLIRPVKRNVSGYKTIESEVMDAVCARFGLPPVMPAEVHELDERICNDERDQNMASPPHPWAIDPRPLGVTLEFWTPKVAKRKFLQTYEEITRG